MSITGNIQKNHCCSINYSLATERTSYCNVTNITRDNLHNITLYKWYHPLILFLSIFRCCIEIDSFKLENTTVYCLRSDVLKTMNAYTKWEVPAYSKTSEGDYTLEEYIQRFVTYTRRHSGPPRGKSG